MRVWVRGLLGLWALFRNGDWLVLMIAIGPDAFRSFLRRWAMDRHFRCAAHGAAYAPALLLALVGIWRNPGVRYATRAVLPMTTTCRLPAYTQQRDGSNGRASALITRRCL
jgi:glucose-6-phosphate isomerase